uniref:Glycine rich superfamily member n=1 Tax=Rhipicephalus appendiculatus TaxID=34631 RepID=A0A131YPD7_RHIAP
MAIVSGFPASAYLIACAFLLSMMLNDGRSCAHAAPTAAPHPGGAAAGGGQPGAIPGVPPRRLGVVIPGMGGPAAPPGAALGAAPAGAARPLQRRNAVVVNRGKNNG